MAEQPGFDAPRSVNARIALTLVLVAVFLILGLSSISLLHALHVRKVAVEANDNLDPEVRQEQLSALERRYTTWVTVACVSPLGVIIVGLTWVFGRHLTRFTVISRTSSREQREPPEAS